MEQLVVRLGSKREDPIHWIVWSDQEKDIIASGELSHADELTSLTERAGQRPITALVPTSDVVLKTVTLPARANRKALAAIPYMLEDELASDVEDLFFALGQQKGSDQAVAIVEKEKLDMWLGWLSDADLFCTKLIPDTLTVPVNETGWSLLTLGENVLLRQGEWTGMQGNASWMFAALEHHAKQQPEPLSLNDYSGEELPHLANVDVQVQTLDMPMQVLVNGALDSKFNLLQQQYKPKKQSSGKIQQWRLVAALAAIALLINLVDKGVEVYKLGQQKDALSAQIESEYKRAFPQTTRIVNVRSQMRQQLSRMEQTGGGGASMLSMMTQLQGAFKSSGVKPQTIRFDRDRAELRMQAIADNFESLESFKRQAEASGFQVEQGAINNQDNRVVGSLLVRS